jgi:hypothetical protein
MTGHAGPLSPRLFLLRNPRRVLPSIVVQALVTALVLAVVTPLTGFQATIEANLRSLAAFTPVTPMRRNDFDETLTAILDKNPGLERRIRAKLLWMRTPMIVGSSYTNLMALESAEQPKFLERVGDRLVRGEFPKPGTEQAAIHADVARARGMTIGSEFGRLVDPKDPAPGKFVVTGIVDGPARVGVVDLDYASKPTFVLARIESFQIVYAKPGHKGESDAYLNAAKDESGDPAFKVWDEAFVRGRIREETENLPVLVDAVVGSITVIISIVVVLLNLIGFQSRSDEFGLLLALGHTRRRLASKIAIESGIAATVALVIGLALGFAFLAVWDRLYLAPKAILIRFFDPYPIALAAALPVAAALASAAVLAVRLRRMDPVAILQRRNA